MNRLEYKVNLYVDDLNRLDALIAKQYDVGSRYVNATFLKKQDGEQIVVDSGSTVLINVKRADGEEKKFEGVVNGDGTVTVPLTYWSLELDDTILCDISIAKDDTLLTTATFTVDVQASNGDSTPVADEDEYISVKQLISDFTADYEQKSSKFEEDITTSIDDAKTEINGYITDAKSDIGGTIDDAKKVIASEVDRAVHKTAKDIVIATNAFEQMTDGTYQASYVLEDMTSSDNVMFNFSNESNSYVVLTGWKAFDGGFYLYASQIPISDILINRVEYYSIERTSDDVEKDSGMTFTELVKAVKQAIHRIGDTIITYNPANPAIEYGGTWEYCGQGKMFIGYDENDSDFNTVGNIGGSKTHTMTIDEMVSHNHILQAQNGVNSGSTNNTEYFGANSVGNTSSVSSYGVTSSSTGGNEPFSIMNPYEVVYKWRKIA